MEKEQLINRAKDLFHDTKIQIEMTNKDIILKKEYLERKQKENDEYLSEYVKELKEKYGDDEKTKAYYALECALDEDLDDDFCQLERLQACLVILKQDLEIYKYFLENSNCGINPDPQEE